MADSAPQRLCVKTPAKDNLLIFRPLADRNALAEEHWQWARGIAALVAAQLPTWFTASDLEGAVAIALVKAAARYDARRGTSFRQFARQRIVGACYDAVRRNEYRERGHLSLDTHNLDSPSGIAYFPPACELGPSPEALAIDGQRAARSRDRLAAAMDTLPDRHRLAIERIYYDGLSLESAAPEFGVGSSRLCQIHREALAMLAAELGPEAA
jgi:RNA polymerase sigma factor for flagellar operon FliA